MISVPVSSYAILATSILTLSLLIVVLWVRGVVHCRAARTQYRLMEIWRFTSSGESTYRCRIRHVGKTAGLFCRDCGSGNVQRMCSGTAHAWIRWTPFGCRRGPKLAYWTHRCANCDLELFRTREPFVDSPRRHYPSVELRPDAHVVTTLSPRADRAGL